MNREKFEQLRKLLDERILVIDGAMGSLMQCACHNHDEEKDGEERACHLADLMVNEDPDLVKEIHRQYLEAGADIIETDSFNSNPVSLQDYGLESEAYSISKKAAELARAAADEYTRKTPGKPRFVAGSIGPTKQMLSIAENGDRAFDKMEEAYRTQIKGLLDGGADIILFETVFDTLTVKAGLYAIAEIEEERGEKIPLIVSATISDSSQRLLSGQTIEAFYASVRHAGLLAVGLNCGLGSEHVLPYLRRLAAVADCGISVYPNAGLPDDCGDYHETHSTFTQNLKECMAEGLVNIIGGCCGTTPAHIHEIAKAAEEYAPRRIPARNRSLILSNMEYSDIGKSEELVQVGERTNVAGSAKFARLVREKNFDEAMEIAAAQARAGAGIIDVCMDDGMSDAPDNMVTFLKMLNSDPETGAIPVMIDSSDWNVIRKALKVSQGKSIVNSISLKEGEDEFLERAREIRKLGAAAVVMLFDEKGQADTFERKCEVAQRAYKLLTEDGFEAADIIFDPNVLTVGTGLTERETLALDFIRATEWIKKNLPGVTVSGGISNLSFAFRGNNSLRHAMHTVFLYHAQKAGLDMAIVNAGMLSLYDEIEPRLQTLLEDVILCRRDNAVEDLVAYAEADNLDNRKTENSDIAEHLTTEEAIAKALLKGKEKEITTLTETAMREHPPMAIINDILMPAMKRVGTLFGEGKMFLPQVIKSAQVMKKAVEVLRPHMQDKGEAQSAGKIMIATVKGDVHDIGKNIVSLIVSCNGYEVEDLGVRVDETTIAEKAEEINPDAILLSGLIAPSLNEMVKVCEELERRGIKTPVFIGGAATSELHCAVKIAPKYRGPVFYSPDAATNLRLLTTHSEETVRKNAERQEELRKKYSARVEDDKKVTPQPDDTKDSVGSRWGDSRSLHNGKTVTPKGPMEVNLNDLELNAVEPFIEWDWVAASLDLGKSNASEKEKRRVIEDAKKLFEEIKAAKSLRIEGTAKVFRARREGNDIIIEFEGGERKLPMLRGENGKNRGNCAADFLSDREDYIALFAVTGGSGLEELEKKYQERGELYKAILTKLIADRLAEAAAKWVHHKLATDNWGFGATGKEGVRIAFGYPASPDHTLKRDVFEILEIEKSTSMRLTENSMIIPSEAVCGMIFSDGEYINVGKISERQIEEYAAKRGKSIEEVKRLIPHNVR